MILCLVPPAARLGMTKARPRNEVIGSANTPSYSAVVGTLRASVILVRAPLTCRCQGNSQKTTDNNGQSFTDREPPTCMRSTG